MENDFSPGADPDEIKCFLHGIGLISADEYYEQVKAFLKRQKKSSKMTYEQIQRKLNENGIFKDASSKNAPLLLCPRKRTAFSLVITRKRGKALKTRTPSASQTTTATITTVLPATTEPVVSPTDDKPNDDDTIDYDQPLDLRLQSKSVTKS